MNQRENIIFNINHYQNELFESFKLLKILETKIFANHNNAEKELELTKRHIKYISFFTSCFLDIATTIKGLIDCELDWERIYFLKNGFVTIYEAINTFQKHQKELILLISEDYKSFEPNFQELQKQLKNFKKEYKFEEVIGKFRNKAGAHYDENFVIYFTNLKSIDKPISIKTISDFSNFLMKLISFWSDLIDLMHKESLDRRKDK